MNPDDLVRRLRRLQAEGRLELPPDLDPRDDGHVDRVAGQLLGHFRVHDDVEAYTLLVELTHGRLVELATSLVRRLAMILDPEDLVAAYMARLFVDVRRDQPAVRHFLGLSYTAMRFDALNQMRLLRRAQERGARYEVQSAERRRPADPADTAEQREGAADLPALRVVILTVVHACYHGLKARDRRVLLLREVEGLSYEQLAEALAVPRSQVGMVLKRARERLARAIAAALRTAEHRRPTAPRAPSRRERGPVLSEHTS